MKINSPKIIKGNIITDDRGKVAFANEFGLEKIKRFYLVMNHRANFIRAWHAHKKEQKFVYCISGAAMVCLVKIDNFKKPNKKAKLKKFFLSEEESKILCIPGGYANGFKNLTQNTKLLFFSNKKTSSSLRDDFRYQYDYWNPWNINFR